MAQIRWSLTASTDLQEIEDFIARDSVFHAVTFVDCIVESTATLLKTPHIGRVVPEFNRQDLREVIFRGYRIVYLVQNPTRSSSFASYMAHETYLDLSSENLGISTTNRPTYRRNSS